MRTCKGEVNLPQPVNASLTADGVLNPGVTQGLGEHPRVDQYDFVCTTQVLWVTDGALDPLRSLTSPLGPVGSSE